MIAPPWFRRHAITVARSGLPAVFFRISLMRNVIPERAAGGESMLQIRAAVLSDDDRLDTHLRNRPGNPFQPNVKIPRPTNTAA